MKKRFESLKELSSKSGYIILAALIVITLALTPYLSKITSQESGEQSPIAINLSYLDGNYDPENDGIETISGVIDFTVGNTEFFINLDESYLATRWEIVSRDSNTSTQLCVGSDLACSFIGLLPSSLNWDDPYFAYLGKDGATYNNIISAQVIYVNYNLSLQNLSASIEYSKWASLDAEFVDGEPICNLPLIEAQLGEGTAIDLDEYCIDPDNGLLAYGAEMDNAQLLFDNSELIINPNRAGAQTLNVIVNDSKNSAMYQTTVTVSIPNISIYCADIENITIETRKSHMLNLSKYCEGSGNISYSHYPAGGLSINYSGALVNISANSSGIYETFFIVNNSADYAVTNIIKITSISNSSDSARITMPRKDYSSFEDISLKLEYNLTNNNWQRGHRSIGINSVAPVQANTWKGNDETIKANVYDFANDLKGIDVIIEKESDGKFSLLLQRPRALKGGKYTLVVEITKGNSTIISEQNFTWGVLAINLNKSVYSPGEHSFVSIGVLDDEGKIVCDSYVNLEIYNPLLEKTTLTTSDGITISDECEFLGVTSLPDYYANYETSVPGTYIINLSAQTENGIRNVIDSFVASSYSDFEIARKSSTRIYPLSRYNVTISIKANSDYYGDILEFVPASFGITPNADIAVLESDDTKILSWEVELDAGENIELSYEYDAPDISPEFYLLGPLQIGAFSEKRQWQIANDAPATAASGSVSANLTAQSCNQENNVATKSSFPSACDTTYPGICGAGVNAVGCNDAVSETFTSNADTVYGGINITVFNSSITNCDEIETVIICYEWWVTATTIAECDVSVDADGGASYTAVTNTCPGNSANPGVTCTNITATEAWTCTNFFGPTGIRAKAKAEGRRNSGGATRTFTMDALWFNVTYNKPRPRINASLNNLSLDFQIGKRVNMSANVSDETQLSSCQFITNNSQGGARQYYNKTITGTSDQCSQNFTITLGRGNVINFSVIVNDTDNHKNYSEQVITVANTPPSTPTIILPTADQKSRIQPGFWLNVTFLSDSDSDPITINYYINDILNASTTSNSTFNASDGVYRLNVSITDGFAHSANASTNFTIDTTSPVINGTLNISTDSIRRYSLVNATFNATDNIGFDTGQVIINDSGRRYFNFSLYGVLAAQLSQNFSISCARGCVINVTGIINDTAGNIKQNSTVFTVANTPPSAPTIIYPPENIYTQRQNLDINITFENDADDDPITIRYYANGVPNGTSSNNITFNASDGYYKINISLFDTVDFGPNATVNFTIDTTRPGVSLIYPPNSSYNVSGALGMLYIVNDANPNTCILYTNFSSWKANQSNSSTVSGLLASFNTTLYPEGIYTWNIYCNDTAGNFAFNATNFTVTVDVNNPRIDFVFPTPQNNTNLSTGTQIFNVTHIDNNPHTLIFSLNSSFANETMEYGVPNFTNLTKTGLHGRYSFYFFANDSAGRFNQTQTRQINVDTRKPQISLEDPQDLSLNNSLLQNFRFNTSDDFLGTKNCSLIMELQSGEPYSNLTFGFLSGIVGEFSGNISNLSYPDGTSYWYAGSETFDPVFEVSAFFNLTFNVSNINPSIVTNLTLDVRYCHSGSSASDVKCDGTIPTGAVEEDQDVSFFNYSGERWVRVGTLNNSQRGTGGNFENSTFFVNATIRDFVNSTSGQVKASIRAHFTNVLGENTFLILDFANLSASTKTIKKDITDGVSLTMQKELDSGYYNWSVGCFDFASNYNISQRRRLNVDKTIPKILNESINDTIINVNENLCLNATVNDTFSSIEFVVAEINTPLSGNTNVTLTNDTTNPSWCSGAGGNVWSYRHTALEEGQVNWSSTYAIDFAGNTNITHTSGLNWSQRSDIFVNSTKLFPLVNFEVNESDLERNYTFSMHCNATCRQDSTFACNDLTIFPQYFNDSWYDIDNFTTQLKSDKMNYSCGNVAIGSSCNSSFTIRTTVSSGNWNFTLRCRAKGGNTPNDFSNETNVTVNDHPAAAFLYPPDTQHLRGITIINSSASFDDQNISRYAVELDNNIAFSSPSLLCDTNLTNCTFNTFAQTQCQEDVPQCFLRLNVTDSDSLVNSTHIQIQIDNSAPAIRLESPINNTYSQTSLINFLYSAFDTNLSTCSLYHNETGIFRINETNETVKNATQDLINITLEEKTIVWNIGCNDTAGNTGFNSTNYTLTIDINNPRINFTNPTLKNDSYATGSFILANISINESNFANITFYLYNSSYDLVNETNYTTLVTLINFTNLRNTDMIYYYNATARDKASRQNSTFAYTITLDNTFPKINFTGPTEPNNTHFNRNYINVNATVNETNIANITFYLYNSLFFLVNETNISINSTMNTSINFSNLADLDERYYYNITIRDKAGLENSTETRQITLDNLTPSVSLNSPSNGSITSGSSIIFNFTAYDSNLKNCSLYGNFSNDALFRENDTNTTVSSAIPGLFRISLSDGLFAWNIRCLDYAGNDAFNATNYSIEVDTADPGAFNLDQPPDGAESQNRSPRLNWTETLEPHFRNYSVFVDDVSDFSSMDFVYRLGGNASNNTLYVPDQWGGNKIWFWKVSAFDELNHSTNTTRFNYTIDNGTPQITLLLPFNHSVENDTIVNFRFNVTDANTISNCSLIVNGVPRATSSEITKNASNAISFSLVNGLYNWSINCSDRAGNINFSAFRNITVNAPPLIPTKFIDTTEDDFGQGILFRTNISGSGNDANVTLNYTTVSAFPNYNLSGNFTSRIFDTGATNTRLERIKWDFQIRNSSDIVGFAMDTGPSDFAVFYRNTSHGIDTTQSDFGSPIDFRANLRRFTLPAGFNANDMIGAAMDDDASDTIYAFFINGQVVDSGDLGNTGPNQDISFTGTSTFTIPAGFNASDIVGFAINSNNNGGAEAAAFFRNGSFVVAASETAPFTFSTVRRYTLPSGFNAVDAIGVDFQSAASDVAMFFNDGSYASAITQADFSTNINFATTSTATYQGGINTTIYSNMSIQSRVSNDSVIFSPWSAVYDTTDSTALATSYARYIQYKAVFATPSKYMTSYLENVSINYTDTNNPRINFSVPTLANNTYIKVDYFFVNTSIFDEHSIDRCRLELDGINETILIIRDGRNASCYINKTAMPEGKHGFRVYANDSFGNANSTEARNITIDLSSPSLALLVIDPSPARYTYENVTINFTFSDLYLNETLVNISFPNKTTLFVSNANFSLNPTNLSIPGNYTVRLFANDTAGNIFSSTTNFFVNDVTVPNVSLVAPDNNTFTKNRTVFFTYLPKDDYNVSNCTLVLNGIANITNITVNESVSNISLVLPDGQYLWSVNCTDNYMNTNGSSFRSIVIDTTPPNATLNYPVNDYNSTLDFITFNWTPIDVFDINVTCNLTINSVNIAVNITNTTYEHINITAYNLSGGANYWNVTCFDNLNNTNTSITRNFTVIKGPELVNATLSGDNETINLTWIPVGYAESYNIYIKDSFMDDFGPNANFTSTHANFTDYNAANKSIRFYKIASVKGGLNTTSIRTVGKYEFELLNNTDAISDWVLISIPFNTSNFVLNNGTNNGSNLITKPLYCIQSLWEYNATISEFKRTDFNGTAWIPAAGSENFTSLTPGRGYWAEINKTCNLTIVGEVPIGNISLELETGWNLVGFYSVNSSRLPQSFQNPYPVVVNPLNSVKAIDRYNPQTEKFEVTVHYTVGGQDWGWIPSSANRNFNTLEPTSGYYYDVLNTATWTHKPVS